MYRGPRFAVLICLCALLAGLLPWCAGCGSGSSSSASAPLPALVVGTASGPVIQTIQSKYAIVSGTGSEDPSQYSMIVFDGNNTTPAQLQANPGPQDFLNAGKPVVILNSSVDHLKTGLSNVLWAYAQGHSTSSSPAVAFFLVHGQNGTPQQLVQIDFPVRIQAAAPGQQPQLLAPTAQELSSDSQRWLAVLQARLSASLGDIPAASVGPGQAILTFDDIKPATVTQSSVLNGQPPPAYTAWGPSGTQPPNFSTSISVTFETRLYAILEGNSASTFQHKIIARQYLLVSPPSPLATSLVSNQYAIYGSNWSGSWPVYSTLGFNNSFILGVQLVTPGPKTDPLGVTENLPESINGVNTLTTSQSHTESTTLSVTAGIQNGNGIGTVGSSWTNSWTWGQASTVSFQDWESSSNVDIPDNAVTYNFAAFGGSDVTSAALNAALLQLPPNNQQIESQFGAPFNYWPPSNAYPQLNQLQTSAMINQSETTWATSAGTLIPPQLFQFVSSAVIYSGEILELTSGTRTPFKPDPDSVFTGYGVARLYQVINLNFAAPGIQPPGLQVSTQTQVPAPWTLSFGEFTQSQGSPYATTQGTVALAQPSSSPTTIDLSYVIQPQQALLTLPVNEICQGNTTSFNPSNTVLDNGQPPLTITIPAGKASATFPLTFQTFNSDTYNVQVVAWLPDGTVSGQQVINPQSAWCLTPPNTLP